MKRILFFLFALATISVKSQTINHVSGIWRYDKMYDDSFRRMPPDTLASAPVGSMAVKSGATYIKNTSGVWETATAGTSQRVYGYRYNKSSWSTLTDFVDSGTAATIVSNNIVIKGGASNYSKVLYINDPTCLEHWSLTTRFTIDSVGDGVSLGGFSYNYLGANSYEVAQLNTSTGALSIGQSAIGTPNTPRYFFTATSLLTFSSTDTIELSIMQQGDLTTATVRNVSTAAAAITVNATYVMNNVNSQRSGMLNNSRLGVWNLGGNIKVNHLSWYVYEPIHAKLMVVGDSKSKYFATQYGGRYADLLNEYFNCTINSSGSGDGAVDLITRTNEAIGLKPEKILLSIGSNDLRHSIPNLIANYDTCVNRYTRAGIDVYHLLGFYEPALDQSLLVNHIIATYPASKIIDCLTPTTQAGILVDGAHGSDAFQRIVFNTIMRSGKLYGTNLNDQNSIKNQTLYTQSGSFNIDGGGTIKGQLGRMVVNNTSPSLSALPIFDLQLGDTSSFSVSKTGTIIHRPSANGIAYALRLPNNHLMSSPIIQLQDSLGLPLVDINTNSKWSLFIGVGAGALNTKPATAFSAGAQNIGIGGPAGAGSPLSVNTTGLNNVGVGGSALGSNTTASNNTAVGCNALFADSTGGFNSAFGQACLAFNRSGQHNNAFGYNALRNNTSSNENTGFGSYTLWNNSTGTGNVALGYRTLTQSNGQSTIINSSQNTGIGWQTGYLSAFGYNNTLIGYNNCAGASIGNDNIMIGSAQTMSGAPNNSTAIGDSITVSVSNMVGIGRTNQNTTIGNSVISTDNGARLQVNGNISTSVVTSAAGTLTLDSSATTYVFTGTTTTWTLPAVSGHTGWSFRIKNRGSGNLTLQAAGSDNIYSTSAVSSVVIAAGDKTVTIDNDGTYWLY